MEGPRLEDMGRWLLIVGLLIAGVGIAFLLAERIPGFGKLPGDFVLRGERFTIVLPIATSILLSILLTLVVNLILRR